MNIFDFLEHLHSLDIQVSAENGKLRVNAPQGAITPEIRSELAARKDEILSVFSALEDIPLERQNGPLPLSLAQENLWQLHRLTPDTAAYTMHAVFRICGPLDIVALETAIHMIVERHESLRTSFPRSANGSSEQVIGPASTVVLRQVPLVSSRDAQEELQLIIEREIRLPFDLSTGPLFRPTLLTINATEHVLILVMHHIISDAHSFGILFDELEQAYIAASKGIGPAWTPLPLQYADYAVWQRKWLAADASALDRKFWQSYLAGEVPALELPLDHPHPPQLVAEGDTVVLPIGAKTSAALDEFCRREGITLFSLVCAAFNALLHRYSGQRDMLVCTPAAARDRSEFSRLVGYFNNTLLLRTDLSRINTWRELLQQVHNSVMNALAHQMFPFMEVAGFPNLARTPLSRAAVAVLDSKEKSFHLPGLQIEKITVFSKAVQYDLSLEVKVHTDGLVAQLMYRRALFERTTVERLIEEWAGILLEMLANPGGPVVRDMDMSRTIALARKTVRPSFTAPRSELEQRLARIWEEVLQIDRVGVDDEFFELGGHSLLALRLFTRIEKETGTQLPLSTLFEKTTIASLARMIEVERSGASWDCLVPIQPKGDRPPVFLVHGIGGGVLGYRDLTNSFGDDRPFLGLQAVGQDGREKYDLTVEAMASRYITVMRSHQPSGPYRIGGYCFGGLVAYEMACQLEKSGEQVSFLALFESALPDTMELRVPPLQRLGAIWRSLPVWLEDYSNMDSTQLLSRLHSTIVRIWAKIQRNPILKRKVRVEETLGVDADDLPTRNIELTDIHMQAALQYRPGEYGGAVTLFRARNRSINDVVFGSLDASMGWRPWAKGGVQVCLVDGFHRNLHLLPYAKSLAAELRKQLDIRDAAE